MLIYFHRLQREEHGQTLILAAVSMLVLALCVMATVNIGQATYERIRLQNTTDAAAYSLAATTARGFNFFAYTNRAMLVHYASILTFMSYLSFLLYFKNTWGRLIKLLQFVPYVGIIFKVIDKIIEWAVKIFDWAVRVLVPVIGAFNYIYFAFQIAMGFFLEASLITDPEVMSKNDPDVKINSPLGIVAKGVNLIAFNKSLDFSGIKDLVPKTSNWNKVNDNVGRQVMSDLINSARHPWVAGTEDGIPLFGRVWGTQESFSLAGLLTVSWDFSKLARTEHGMMSGGLARKHDQAYAVDQLRIYASGSVAGSYKIEVGVNYLSEVWGDWIDTKGNHRERLVGVSARKPDKIIKCTSWVPLACAVTDIVVEPMNLAWKAIRIAFNAWFQAQYGGNKGKHHIYLGASPFMKFKPKAKHKLGFNQVDFMIVGSKANDKLKKFFFQTKYGVDTKVSGSRIDTKEGTDSLVDFEQKESPLSSFQPGYNAISVARAYYHRPGDWQEHPNFFNPFWGAKLHPVAHHQLLDQLGAGNYLDELVTH